MILSADQIVRDLADLFEHRAYGRYGLALISQRAHALQAAQLAGRAGLPDPVVVAALFHDVGHMTHKLGEHPAAQGVDDQHEIRGANWLEPWFIPEVVEPIRLHVQAKRYLCSVEQDYFGHLSPDSLQSLALQGGRMSDTEVACFRMTAGWSEAVSLRRIDERAKDPTVEVADFDSFIPLIRRCLKPTLAAPMPPDSFDWQRIT